MPIKGIDKSNYTTAIMINKRTIPLILALSLTVLLVLGGRLVPTTVSAQSNPNKASILV